MFVSIEVQNLWTYFIFKKWELIKLKLNTFKKINLFNVLNGFWDALDLSSIQTAKKIKTKMFSRLLFPFMFFPLSLK